MTVHREIAFEDAIERAMHEAGWRQGQPANYRRELGLDTAMLMEFFGATQVEQWNRLVAYSGGDPDTAQRAFADRLAKEIDERGAVDVLRHGVKDRGLLFRLAYFRPAHTLADDALVQYEEKRHHPVPPALAVDDMELGRGQVRADVLTVQPGDLPGPQAAEPPRAAATPASTDPPRPARGPGRPRRPDAAPPPRPAGTTPPGSGRLDEMTVVQVDGRDQASAGTEQGATRRKPGPHRGHDLRAGPPLCVRVGVRVGSDGGERGAARAADGPDRAQQRDSDERVSHSSG